MFKKNKTQKVSLENIIDNAISETQNIDTQVDVIVESPANEAKRLKRESKVLLKLEKAQAKLEKAKAKIESQRIIAPTYINVFTAGLKGRKRIADDTPQVVRSFGGDSKSNLQAICAFVIGIFLMKLKAQKLNWDLREKLLEAQALELSGEAFKAFEEILVPVALHPLEYNDFIEKETGISMIKNYPSYPDSPTHRGFNRLSKPETKQASEKTKDNQTAMIDTFAIGGREIFRKDPRVSIKSDSIGKYYPNPQMLDVFPVPIESIEYVDAHLRALELVRAYPNLR